MSRRVALLVAALALIVSVPAALADGDPASDVLPTEDAFYPYAPKASPPLVAALDRLLEEVRAAGYPMKVALIATAADLGAYPQLFNSPQRYADLLASELPTNPHGKLSESLHLLVVMPGGFGGKDLGDRVDEALARVKIDAADQTDGLARAALMAVARIATVNGRETRVPPEATSPAAGASTASASATPYLIVGGILLALLAAGAAGYLLLRRRRSDERPDEPTGAQENPGEARSS